MAYARERGTWASKPGSVRFCWPGPVLVRPAEMVALLGWPLGPGVVGSFFGPAVSIPKREILPVKGSNKGKKGNKANKGGKVDRKSVV